MVMVMVMVGMRRQSGRRMNCRVASRLQGVWCIIVRVSYIPGF